MSQKVARLFTLDKGMRERLGRAAQRGMQKFFAAAGGRNTYTVPWKKVDDAHKEMFCQEGAEVAKTLQRDYVFLPKTRVSQGNGAPERPVTRKKVQIDRLGPDAWAMTFEDVFQHGDKAQTHRVECDTEDLVQALAQMAETGINLWLQSRKRVWELEGVLGREKGGHK